jgi:hypothetical protein
MNTNREKIEHRDTEHRETSRTFPESLAPWSLCLCGEFPLPFASIRGSPLICVNLRSSAVKFCDF